MLLALALACTSTPPGMAVAARERWSTGVPGREPPRAIRRPGEGSGGWDVHGVDDTVAATMDVPPAPVVVIGAGAAGLAAAREIGDDVIVLDADSEAGGRARWSGGYLLLADTPELAAEDRSYSAAEIAEDWETLTGAPATDRTRAYLEASPDVRDRLVAMGVGFELGHEDPVFHHYLQHHVIGAGQALVDALLADLPATVDVRLGVSVTGLVFDGDRVVGVDTAAGPIEAGEVVIASGGFVRRDDLLDRYTDLPEGSWGPSTDAGGWGAAIGWAGRYGLGLDDPGAIGWNANLMGVPSSSGTPVGVTRSGSPPWVWVDQTGSRFVDESAGWSLSLAAQVARHGDVWAVGAWDEILAAVDAANVAAVEAARAAGEIRCGDDSFLVAQALGIPAGPLDATLRGVVGVRAAGGYDTLGRSAGSLPELTGELCGVRVGRLAAKNYGGLATDGWGRVLDRTGAVVPGLYAAGEACGMGGGGLGGRYGFDGSLGAVVWSGWRAGETLAADRRLTEAGLR